MGRSGRSGDGEAIGLWSRYEVVVYGRSDGRLVVKRRLQGLVLRVRYGLARGGEVVLRLYDGAGRLVQVVDEGWRRAGWHPVAPLTSGPQESMIVIRVFDS